MTPRTRAIAWILLSGTAVFALCVIAIQFGKFREPPLPRFNSVPDFQLTERHGQPISIHDLRGKVWLADFIYSSCPGPCPMISSRLSDLQKQAFQKPDVRFVSISTDPANDTPAVLQAYAERFHASDKWLFLTGDTTKVHDLIQRGFSLAVVEQPGEKERVIHSTKLVLVDKNGVIRKYFDGQNGGANSVILHEIDRLLRE